jgi:hypothetical protein
MTGMPRTVQDRNPVQGFEVSARIPDYFAGHSGEEVAGIECVGPAQFFECCGIAAEGQQPEPIDDCAVKLVGIYMDALPVDSYPLCACRQGIETQFLDQEAVKRPDNEFFHSVPAGARFWFIPQGTAEPVPGEEQIQGRKQRTEKYFYRFVRPFCRNRVSVHGNAEAAQRQDFQCGVVHFMWLP